MLIKIMNRTHQRYSCCADISNSATTYLAHVGSKSTKEAKSNSSSTKWTKSSRVQRLFVTPNGRKSNQEYSIIIDYGSSQNPRTEPDYVPVAFCTVHATYSAVSFTKRDFESMNSTLFFLVANFSGFPLYFPSYTVPKVPQPNFFSFSKSFHSNFGNSGFLFLPSFSNLLGF